MILYVSRYSKIMASSRYRVYGWAQIISQMGYAVRILFQHVSVFRKSKILKKIVFLLKIFFYSRKASVIVFHKYYPPVLFQKILNKKKIIFDFDDRIYTAKLLLNRKSRFSLFLNLSDRIIVSVQSIKDEILFNFPGLSEKIVVIPTLIDIKKISHKISYLKKKRFKENKSLLNIGWIGTSGGFKYLGLIEDSIGRLIDEFPRQVIFSVISDKPFSPKNISFPVKNIKWSLPGEYRYFLDLDISIMPLDDSEKAISKAGFKIIQSLACGIPVVASSVGINSEIIGHGRNGFLAKSPQDFYIYLKQFMLDKKLIKKMGIDALKSVKKFDYNFWKKFYMKQIF